jgi:hypothetical protein
MDSSILNALRSIQLKNRKLKSKMKTPSSDHELIYIYCFFLN